MTSAENPYFTRSIVNRVWAAYFGIGIVNALDDLRASNPESNPALMSYLSQYLIEQEYDLRSLMRQIMNSETYQRSSVPIEGNQADRKHFSHYYPKRLMAEVIHDAIASEVLSQGDQGDPVIRLECREQLFEDLWAKPAADHL
jgi:hypothetical protein